MNNSLMKVVHMKLGWNWHKCKLTGGGHFGGNLYYRKKPIFKLKREFDKSNKWECPQVQTDRRRPFCWPSWLSFIEHNPYLNLKESLTTALTNWRSAVLNSHFWCWNSYFLKVAIFFCIVGLSLFGKEGSGTPVCNILVRALLTEALHIWNLIKNDKVRVIGSGHFVGHLD